MRVACAAHPTTTMECEQGQGTHGSWRHPVGEEARVDWRAGVTSEGMLGDELMKCA